MNESSPNARVKQNTGRKLLQFSRRSFLGQSPKLYDLWDGNAMPKTLLSCMAFIYAHNVGAKHVFRKNGNKVAHEVLRAQLHRPIKEGVTDNRLVFYANTAYDVCSALKAYVKDVPGGLLQKELASEWQKIIKAVRHHKGITDKIHEKLVLLVLKLSVPNRTLLCYWLVLAHEISLHQPVNEMSEKSLSIVLMPCTFEKVIDIRKTKQLNAIYDLLEYMIRSASSVIGSQLFFKISQSLETVGRALRIIPHHNSDILQLQHPALLSASISVDGAEISRSGTHCSRDSGLNSCSMLDESSASSCSQRRSEASRMLGSSLEDLLQEPPASTGGSEEPDSSCESSNPHCLRDCLQGCRTPSGRPYSVCLLPSSQEPPPSPVYIRQTTTIDLLKDINSPPSPYAATTTRNRPVRGLLKRASCVAAMSQLRGLHAAAVAARCTVRTPSSCSTDSSGSCGSCSSNNSNTNPHNRRRQSSKRMGIYRARATGIDSLLSQRSCTESFV